MDVFAVHPVAELLLGKFLLPVNLLCLKRVAKHFYLDKRVESFLDKRIRDGLHEIVRSLLPPLSKSDPKDPWFLFEFCRENGGIISGSAILCILLDEDWDIYHLNIFTTLPHDIYAQKVYDILKRFNAAFSRESFETWSGCKFEWEKRINGCRHGPFLTKSLATITVIYLSNQYRHLTSYLI